MRRSLILLLALLAGVITLALMQFGLRPDPAADAGQPKTQAVFVLVYARDLPRGTLIDETGLRWQEQLATALPAGAITAGEQGSGMPAGLDGKLLRSDVLAGEVVRPETLVDGAASFMSLTLTPGMRAIGISVTPQKLAGGFILPEDRIDLIHTASGDFDGDGKASSFSQTILENIRVLAVGDKPTSRVTFQTVDEQAAAASATSDITMKGETITLEMSDEEAGILFSAQASGQISLALRALEDHGPSRIGSTAGIEMPQPAANPAPVPSADVAGAAPAEPARPGPPAKPPALTVRLIQGGSASYVEVPLAGPSAGGTKP